MSPEGSSGIGSLSSPMSVSTAFSQVSSGEEIRFLPGKYAGCWGLDSDASGTYDAPIVIKAEPDVIVNCCSSGRKSCFNLEFADYVAIDGFTLTGGDYGIRAVGGYAAEEHQKGVVMINNHGLNQNKDPFFSGASDWIVVENNIAHGAGSGDGHGIYLSNGGDWMIARNNELYDNVSSDFQINADPSSTCNDIDYFDPACDGSALEGLGRGISEFILFENNYFHDGSVGPNFTSVRNSVMRNNIIGLYSRHGTSFWQETDNPNLGSSNNIIEHNLFIGEDDWSPVLQFAIHSKNNIVRNNVLLGVSRSDTTATANDRVLLLRQDSTTEGFNTFAGNYFIGGYFESFTPSISDQHVRDFNSAWFADFPIGRMGSSESFKPTDTAPFIKSGELLDTSPLDRTGTLRINPVDLGPWQVTLAVDNTAPTASFSYICTNLDCSFSDNSSDSDGTIVSRFWVFGDGNSSTAADPSHTYTTSGTYDVTLLVTDNNNDSNSISKSISLEEPEPVLLPDDPTNLTASVQSTGRGKNKLVTAVQLNWSDNSSNEDVFIIERCKETGRGKNKKATCNFAELAAVGADISSFSDNSPDSGSYQYRVKARNVLGDSDYVYSDKVKI